MLTQNSLESRAISNFVSNKENTMHAVVTSSVGVILIRLAKAYFDKDIQSFQPDEINQLYQACEEQMKLVAASSAYVEEWQTLIAYLNSKAKEKLDKRLDSFTIYDPDYTESDHKKKYVISLKLVTVLVWYAIHDNTAYIHHYTNEENPLAIAEADKKHREASWFENLARLKADPVCHQGVRNSFVFLLNKAYKEVSLIEDTRLFVYQYLKEAIFKAFLELYRNNQDPDIFKPALIHWMTKDDPSVLTKMLGDEAALTLTQALNAVFIQHGTDPKDEQIKNVISAAFYALPFYCDDQLLPHIALMHQVFQLKAIMDSQISYHVLSCVYEWMHRTQQLECQEEAAHLSVFHRIYHAYYGLARTRSYLELEGILNAQMKNYFAMCEEYFRTVLSFGLTTIPQFDVHQLISDIEKEISTYQTKDYDGHIENFFANWFSASRDSRQNIYRSLLLDPAFKQAVVLSDEAILRSMSQGDPLEVYLTPYEINRFFLHALMTRSNQWTDCFYQHFSSILEFIDNDFNGNEVWTSQNLKENSYRKILLDQLRYLKATFDRVEIENHKKSFYDCFFLRDKYLLLPEQIKTPEEIRAFQYFISDTNLYKQLYGSYRIHLEKILHQSSALEYSLVPLEYAANFIKNYYNSSLAREINISAFRSFFRAPLPQSHYLVMLQAHSQQLDALFNTDSYSNFYFINSLGKECGVWLLNELKDTTWRKLIPFWNLLSDYIRLFSKSNQAVLLEKLQPNTAVVGAFNHIFTNINEIYQIFQLLDPELWELFYNKWARHGYVSGERKAQGVYSPSCLLDAAIKAQHLPLVMFLLKKQIPFSISNFNTIHIILKACVELKDARLVRFFNDHFSLITTLFECTSDAVELEKIKKCCKHFLKLFLNDLSLHIQFRILQETYLRELIKIKWQINFLLKIDIRYIEHFPEIFDATFCALIRKEKQTQSAGLNQRQKAKYILKRGDLLRIEGLTYFERAEILVELYVSDHRSLPLKNLGAITACLKSTNAVAIIALNDARAAELIFLSRCVESLSIHDKMNIIRKWQHDTVFINSLAQAPIGNLYQPYSNMLSFTKSQLSLFSDDKKFLRHLTKRPASSDLSHLINHFHHSQEKLSVWLQEVSTNSTFQLHSVKLSDISLEHNNRLDNVRQSALSTQDESSALLLIYDASIRALLNLLERVSGNCAQHAARLYVGQMRKTLTFALETYSEKLEENVSMCKLQ